MGRVIQVKKEPKPIRKTSANPTDEYLATLCYYYPQYTFRQAKQLPYKHVRLLMRVARKMRAAEYSNMVQIVAAPHSEKGKSVGKLMKHYNEIMDEN